MLIITAGVGTLRYTIEHNRCIGHRWNGQLGRHVAGTVDGTAAQVARCRDVMAKKLA